MKEDKLSNEQKEMIARFIDTYQKPVQLQVMALVESLKFQKSLIAKEVWKPYINSFCEVVERDLAQLKGE